MFILNLLEIKNHKELRIHTVVETMEQPITLEISRSEDEIRVKTNSKQVMLLMGYFIQTLKEANIPVEYIHKGIAAGVFFSRDDGLAMVFNISHQPKEEDGVIVSVKNAHAFSLGGDDPGDLFDRFEKMNRKRIKNPDYFKDAFGIIEDKPKI